MKEEKDTINILRDELVNEISDHEKLSLEEWSNSKIDNRKFRQLMNKMKLSPEIEHKGKEMKSFILKRVNERIDKEKRFRLLLRISTVAASILLLLGVTSYFSYEQGFRKVNSQLIEMSNPLGMLSTITLPDGSKVVLNAGTTISYPSAFVSKNREVSITGEAFFEVAHDANHPFIVKTDQINIEVLGTQFNVKAYENEERTEISLSEGKVGVRTGNQGELLFLDPGQQAYFNKHDQTLTIHTVNIIHYTSWKEGKYYFSAPLKEIACQLERIFNVRIQITSPQLQNIVFTGDFVNNENLEQILRIITADKRSKYRIEDDLIYIEER